MASTSPPPSTQPPPPSTSPPPSSSNSPPPSTGSPPPSSSTPPPVPSTTPPPSQPSANPPQDSPPSTPSPPAQSPPPVTPPPTTSPSPPATPPAPPLTPPSSTTPPQGSSPPPQPPANSPPGSTPSPPSRPPESAPPSPPRSPPGGSPAPPQQEAPVPPQSSASPPTPGNSLSSPASLPTPNTPATPPSSTIPGNTPPGQPSQPRSPPSRISPPSPQNPVPPARNGSNPVAPDASNSGNGGINTSGVVAIAVVATLLLLSAIGLAFCILRKRRKKRSGHGGYVMPASIVSSTQSDSIYTKTQSSAPVVQSNSGSSDLVYSSSEPSGLGNSRSWFTYDELVKATNGFSAENLLGEGGFGSVYKGYLSDGRVVAVKQLKIGGGQGEREFQAEVEIISRVHHRHLVSLVGYCISEHRRLLVYDYVPNNTLHFHLHGEGRPVLDWAIRVKVAVGAARGIAYLHEDCDPRIIHGDIKSSNILLDNNFEARVSDFGLAKLCLDANTHVTTRVMGTFGYMAPEYASSGKLTEKSDVFSFGVVLLELITGRKPVDSSRPLGHESLVEWARPLLRHALETEEFEGLVDPRLGKNYVESEVFRMIEAAAACVRHSAAKRPKMGQIVRAFDSLDGPDLSNGMRPGESENFDPAQRSAEIRLFQRMAFGGDQDFSTDIFSQSGWSSENDRYL